MAKNELNGNKVGLALGALCALLHAVWALAVGLGAGQRFIGWVMPLHFIDIAYSITPFSWNTALMLVVAAFVGGYVMGWVFAWIWNALR